MTRLHSFLFSGLILMFTACDKDQDPNEPAENDIPCLPANLETNVLAFYPFSNGSINDFSGNNRHLTNTTTAAPSVDRNGNQDCAYEFDLQAANAEFLTTVNTNFLNNLNEFSISLWYQPLDPTRGGGEFEVLACRDFGSKVPNRYGWWSVGLYDCRRAVFGRANSVWDQVITANPFDCEQEVILRTNTWHHLVATLDITNDEMKIYRDGVLQETAPINSTGPTQFIVQDMGDLFFGVDYTGRLDDIILYSKVLDQAEVNQLKELEGCCEN